MTAAPARDTMADVSVVREALRIIARQAPFGCDGQGHEPAMLAIDALAADVLDHDAAARIIQSCRRDLIFTSADVAVFDRALAVGDDTQFTIPLRVRISAAQDAIISKRMAEEGLPKSTVVRRMMFGPDAQ